MAGYCWWLVSLKLGPNPARLRPPAHGAILGACRIGLKVRQSA